MDPQAAKMIGAGIACIGMGGAGVGVGTIFGHYLAAALRERGMRVRHEARLDHRMFEWRIA